MKKCSLCESHLTVLPSSHAITNVVSGLPIPMICMFSLPDNCLPSDVPQMMLTLNSLMSAEMRVVASTVERQQDWTRRRCLLFNVGRRSDIGPQLSMREHVSRTAQALPFASAACCPSATWSLGLPFSWSSHLCSRDWITVMPCWPVFRLLLCRWHRYQRVLHATVRLVHDPSPHNHVTQALKELHWLPIAYWLAVATNARSVARSLKLRHVVLG